MRAQNRHEHAYSLLIFGILWVFSTSNELGEPGRGLEKGEIRQCTSTRPVVICFTDVTGPEVQAYPDRLLRGKIRVTTVSPKATGIESTFKVLLTVARCDLPGLFVLLLRALVIYGSQTLVGSRIMTGYTHSIVADRQWRRGRSAL